MNIFNILYHLKHQKFYLFNLSKLVFMVCALVVISLSMISNSHAESFSNYSSLGGSTDRLPNKKISKSCKDFTCGPINIIELSMKPTPDAGFQNYNAGENGTFDQMLKLGDDLNKLGPAAVMGQVGNIAGQLGIEPMSTEIEREIKITIPMIDYGYSGTFNNILIKVSDEGKEYRSIVQGLTNKDSHKEYTGSITIEKYTPFVLKGSYSAALKRYKPILPKDMRLVGQPNRFCPAFSDPSTPACTMFTLEGTGNINGQFSILSPWENDDRLNKNVDLISSHVDPLRHDIKFKMAEMGIDIDVDKEFDRLEAGLKSSGRGGSSNGGGNSSTNGDIYGGCNCSCNFFQSATTQCKTACSAAFSACNGERYKPAKKTAVNNNLVNSLFPKLPTKQDQTKVKGAKLLGIDQNFINKLEKGDLKVPKNIKKKFISLLEKNHPGQANAPIRDMMIKAFDQMPDDSAKMIMLKSMGGL